MTATSVLFCPSGVLGLGALGSEGLPGFDGFPAFAGLCAVDTSALFETETVLVRLDPPVVSITVTRTGITIFGSDPHATTPVAVLQRIFCPLVVQFHTLGGANDESIVTPLGSVSAT
jgi:hypothetical protein